MKKSTYIINDFTLVSPDRNRKDIQSLKSAITSAESVYHPNRIRLYDLYHDIFTMDGFLKGIIGKRINSVLNKKLKFYDKKGGEVEAVTKLFKTKKGRDLITQILNSIFWGISGVEFCLGEDLDFREIPRKHIKPEKGIITKSQYGSFEGGFKYKEMPFVWVIGDENNLGLLLTCSMYAIYKRGNFGDWAQYVEIFGQPVRIMYYDAYDTATKSELKKILSDSGNSLAIMLPKQAQFDMKDGKSSNGNGELQKSFKDACNEEMAITILGNTETTSSSKSSGYAQSKEHADQQDEIIASDLSLVENMLNSPKFLAILKSYGYDVEGGYFKYDVELNLEKLKQRLEIDSIVCTKVPFDDDYWYNTYGIPKPKNYEQLKEAQSKSSSNEDNEENPKEQGIKKKDPPKKKEVNASSQELPDFYTPNLLDKFFQKLADFFDHARH